MAKLEVTLVSQNVSINAVESAQTAILNVKDIILSGSTNPTDLISNDKGNALKLGSDNKLIVDDSADFLATYLLARGTI